MNWDITSTNRNIISTITNNNANGGCGTISTNESPSIWTDQKTNNNAQGQKITQTVASETKRLTTTYVSNIAKQYNKMENLEKILKHSEFSVVASTSKMGIKDISEKTIPRILGSLESKCANCKTENEVKQVIKDIEKQLLEQKFFANTYAQRAYKAQALENKLSTLDEETRNKIDTKKIIDELTKSPELPQIETGDKNEENNSIEKISQEYDKALENDEISKVVDSLIKYLDKGEKDDIIEDYLKGDEKKTNIFNSNSNNHPFSVQKKNPFLPDV